MEFQEFTKIARYSRLVTVTEKIDGTNSQVFIHKSNEKNKLEVDLENIVAIDEENGLTMYAGSRTRWITPKNDNFGFATWVYNNAKELFELGPGHHYGEWWGSGIQRKYNQTEKHWSLFNTAKWLDNFNNEKPVCPKCCKVVPVLWQGNFDNFEVNEIMMELGLYGSKASPGFMKPEGIVIYHSKAGIMFKKTFEKDETGKWDN